MSPRPIWLPSQAQHGTGRLAYRLPVKRGIEGSPAQKTARGTTDWEIYTYGLNGVDNYSNGWLSHILLFSLAFMVLLLLVLRLQRLILVKIRKLLLLHGRSREALIYWAIPANPKISFIKKHILWAPIGRHRHNKEIRLSSVINFGTLPTRLQAILLLIYFGSNVVYCTVWLDWTLPKPHLIAAFRGRTGVMAVVNMIPLFLLAGRNNPLISLFGINFDTWNLIHRWMGRIVALESTCHVTAWTINKVDLDGWSGVWGMLRNSSFIQNGFIAGTSFLLILISSPSPIRHAAYETFLHAHIILALSGLIGVFYHLKLDTLPQILYLFIIIAIWSYDRLARLLWIIYRNCGVRLTRVRIVALQGGDGACRVDIEMVRPWKYMPGTHAYIYLPWISLWQSHPFSIAWSNDLAQFTTKEGCYLTNSVDTEGRDSNSTSDAEYPEINLGSLEQNPNTEANLHNPEESQQSRSIQSQNSNPIPRHSAIPKASHESTFDARWARKNTVSMIMARRHGMTKALWNVANSFPNKTMYLTGLIEGPYGGHHKLTSYGMVVLVAGGVGITHCIGWVRELLRRWKEGTGCARKVVLVWVVPDKEQYDWCREWFNDIFSISGWSEFVSIQLYVSKPNGHMVVSPSTKFPAYAGRPQWDNLFDKFVEERLGTIGVTVCGPGTLSDSIRLAVRKQIHRASIDFLEEAFTW